MENEIFSCYKCKKRTENFKIFLALDEQGKATKVVQFCESCNPENNQPKRLSEKTSKEDAIV